ncbi:ATP-binding protein [Streptomyces sp. NPDC058807]|uniref:ATP-binding protein n=1 Tax=unclassified Streptomyces TaxID=2593676 RepID=UPI00369304A5
MSASGEAVPALRAFARDTARRWGVAEEGIYALRVAVSELVTNAVLHSGSDDVEVAMRLRGTTAIIQVKDSGTWMPSMPSAEVRQEADEIHGRGLNIVRAYATRCTVESSAKGTQVCAEIDVSAPAPQCFEFDAELESIDPL